MTKYQREFGVGEIYHVFNRGVEKRKIFLKTQDYSRFILALEFFNRTTATNLWDYIAKVGPGPTSAFARLEKERAKKSAPIIELLAFALMPNHYHLIIREIKQGGISLFMNKLGGYSSYFNRQYDRVGILFQSRYKAIHIETDAQLNIIFPYVHANPVELKEPRWKEGKVKDTPGAMKWLEDYKWSSYRDYVGAPTFPYVTQRTFFRELYGGERKCRKVLKDWIDYKAAVEQSSINFLE